jgi:hypothetical protein
VTFRQFRGKLGHPTFTSAARRQPTARHISADHRLSIRGQQQRGSERRRFGEQSIREPVARLWIAGLGRETLGLIGGSELNDSKRCAKNIAQPQAFSEIFEGLNSNNHSKSRRWSKIFGYSLSESDRFSYSVWSMAIATSDFVPPPRGSGFTNIRLVYGDVEDRGDLVNLEEQIPCIAACRIRTNPIWNPIVS